MSFRGFFIIAVININTAECINYNLHHLLNYKYWSNLFVAKFFCLISVGICKLHFKQNNIEKGVWSYCLFLFFWAFNQSKKTPKKPRKTKTVFINKKNYTDFLEYGLLFHQIATWEIDKIVESTLSLTNENTEKHAGESIFEGWWLHVAYIKY